MRRIGAVALTAAIFAVGGAEARDGGKPPVLSRATLCSGEGLTVDAGFEQAGLAACQVTAGGRVELTIRPETLPINPSPWYAARLKQAEQRARQLRLVYTDARHRYRPWLSVNGGPWQPIDASPVDETGRIADINLPPFRGTAVVAAQPLRPLETVMAEWKTWTKDGIVTEMLRARSHDGRAVPLFRHGPASAKIVHVFATRQHPPETTGAAAFDGFARALLAARPAAKCPGHAFVFAPIVNPDGIARGFWRSNVGRVDLNRDWATQAQPETSAIAKTLIGLSGTATIGSVLDFHSTRSDALYTPVATSPSVALFASAVADAAGLRLVPTRSTDAATLKSWAERQFATAAFTVELADGQSPASAEEKGAAIAAAFLRELACPPKDP